jgi:ligand-binding sensor domain-containing protein
MNSKISCFSILVLLVALSSNAQIINSFQLGSSKPPVPGLAGNGITDIVASRGALWFGTGHGLSKTLDEGRSFQTFGTSHGLGRGSISAIFAKGDTLWVATASDTLTKVSSDYLSMGTGLSLSTDNGQTWKHFPQPPLNYTPIQNLSYDIDMLKGTVWIASFGGGLLRSDDWGQTWQPAPPDSFNFDPGLNLNHRAFSVLAADGDLWVGTAAGINKSGDNGGTWTNFNHTNQSQPISGNFVVALARQKTKSKNIIWAATWKAEDENESYAVSWSDNGGLTWQTTLQDEKAHNFCFDDSVVYVATDNGLFKSPDYGMTWYHFSTMEDKESGEKVYSTEIYSAYYDQYRHTLWVGTADGLALSANNGYSWKILRAFKATGKAGAPRTYAYPNPFSPVRQNLLNGEGFVRLQYDTKKDTIISIRVYDFAMDLVTTVTDGKFRPGPGNYSEVWNGRNDYGDYVANGVYFYCVEIGDDGTYWGKVMVIN